MLPVLKAASAGEVRISDVIDQLADAFALSSEERAQLLPSRRAETFANRTHWAKFYLSKAGLIEVTRRAHFKITTSGRELLAKNPPKIDIKLLNEIPAFQHYRARTGKSAEDIPDLPTENTRSALTPDELIRTAYETLEQSLSDEILTRLQTSSPSFFEHVVVRLLSAMGYGGAESSIDRALVVGGSGDGGIDGVIDQDPLGLDRVYVQAKRHKDDNSVGPAAIRDFFGSLDRFKATKGLFITTSSFTRQAEETAGQLSKRIVLINGEQLARLLIRYDVGFRVETILKIKKIDEDFFDF